MVFWGYILFINIFSYFFFGFIGSLMMVLILLSYIFSGVMILFLCMYLCISFLLFLLYLLGVIWLKWVWNFLFWYMRRKRNLCMRLCLVCDIEIMVFFCLKVLLILWKIWLVWFLSLENRILIFCCKVVGLFGLLYMLNSFKIWLMGFLWIIGGLIVKLMCWMILFFGNIFFWNLWFLVGLFGL